MAVNTELEQPRDVCSAGFNLHTKKPMMPPLAKLLSLRSVVCVAMSVFGRRTVPDLYPIYG